MILTMIVMMWMECLRMYQVWICLVCIIPLVMLRAINVNKLSYIDECYFSSEFNIFLRYLSMF